MTDNNSPQKNESDSKTSSPPSIMSLTKCAAGAIAVTLAIFLVPWGALSDGVGAALGIGLSVLFGILSPLANKGVLAVLVALVLTCVCFAIKYEDSSAGSKAFRVGLFSFIVLLLIGVSYTVDRPRSDALKLAQNHPALYKKITQLTSQEHERLKDIWDSAGTWDLDRELTTEVLGPDVEKLGTFGYRSLRRELNDLGRYSPVKESLPIHGCRDMVAAYRKVKIPGAQLTVNDKVVSIVGGPDQCKWLGFNKLRLVTPH